MKLYILHSWAFFFTSAAHLYEPPITTAADNNFDYCFFGFFYLPQKTSPGISCESSWQTIHMKCQHLFSLKIGKIN